MSVRTDVINLNVNINGDKGKNELNQLRKRAAELKAEMAQQNKRTQEGRARWAELNTELKSADARMATLRKSIGLAALSQKELTSEMRRLQALKGVATPQTKEFFELQKQIDLVSSRLHNVRTGTFGFKAWVGSIKDEVKQFGMLAASALGIQFLIGQTRNLINTQAKMADENANIAKTTGLHADAVRELNKEFKTMDTRTSNSRLRDLATEAGKLGVEGVENIKKFVDQANKIEVALGEDLGEGGLIKVAKIAGIFKTDMTNVASGINAVGAASAATESYLVDFGFRMSGTSQTAKLAAGDIFGFASALEVNGQNAELAATALNTFFLDFISKSEDFGQAAGFAKGELSKLINDKGANEAFLQWLQRLKDMSPTTQAFIENMRKLGIDGARGSNVMLVLSENIGMVREQQALANTEIQKGTSIIDEYNVKNNNFAATVAKIQKDFNSFFTSDNVNKVVTGIVESFGRFLKFLPEILGFVQRNSAAFKVWTAALILNSSWMKTSVDWIGKMITGLRGQTAAQILATAAAKADIIATTALGVVKALLAGNITKLRQEWALLTAAIGTNPFGVLLIALGAAIVLYNEFIRKNTELSSSMQFRISVEKRVIESTTGQISKMQELEKVMNNQKLSLDARKKAMQDLIALNPAILSGLSMEGTAYANNKKLLDEYIRSLRLKAEVEARSNIRAEALQRQYEAEAKAARAAAEFNSQPKEIRRAEIAAYKMNTKQPFDLFSAGSGAYKRGQEALKELNEAKAIVDQADKAIEASLNRVSQTTTGGIQAAGVQTARTVGDIRAAISKLDEDLNSIATSDSAAIAANRAERAKLDKELAALEGRKTKADRSGEREANKLRKVREEIAALRNEIEAQKADMERGDKARDEQEIARVTNKFAALLAKAKQYAAEYAELTALQQQELDILFARQFERRSEKEYDDSLNALSDFYNRERQLAGESYAAGRIDKLQYSNLLRKLDVEEARDRATIANDYAATVKKAHEDAEKFKTKAVQEGVEERERIHEQTAQDKVYNAERNVQISPVGSNAELAARKALLQARFDMETEFMDKTSAEYLLRQEQLNKDLEDMDRAHWTAKMQFALDMLQGVGQIYSEFLDMQNNKDRAQLEAEKDINEEKKKDFKKKLDSKRISRAVYDAEISKLDGQMEQREKEYRKREAKRQKSAAIFNAILSTAQGVVRAYADYAWPYNLIVSAIVGGLGAAQIANISSQKEPIGRKGLIVPGPSHENGGVDLVERRSGKTLANVEGGEPLWVFSKETYRNNKDILDELIHNSMNRNGARISAGKWMNKAPGINTTRIIPLMRNGGVIGESSTGGTDMTLTNELIARMVHLQGQTVEEIATMKTKLRAVVEYRDLEEKEALLNKAKSVAGINQAA